MLGAVYFILKNDVDLAATVADIEKKLEETKRKSHSMERLKWEKVPTKAHVNFPRRSGVLRVTNGPLEPKTAFYDWLYAGSLYPHRDWIRKLSFHDGFSNIEFNPFRSINCQARSIALFLSLMKRKELDDAIQSQTAFLKRLQTSSYRPQLRSDDFASKELFAHGS